MSVADVKKNAQDKMAKSIDTLKADLAKVRKLAQLLDAQFEIFGQKVGWDAIVTADRDPERAKPNPTRLQEMI